MQTKSKNSQRPLTLALALSLALLAGCDQANRAEQEAGSDDAPRSQSSGPNSVSEADKAKLASRQNPQSQPESRVADMPAPEVYAEPRDASAPMQTQADDAPVMAGNKKDYAGLAAASAPEAQDSRARRGDNGAAKPALVVGQIVAEEKSMAAPVQIATDQVAPATPGESAPSKSAPGESAPGESAPGESAPGESALVVNTENYDHTAVNPIKQAAVEPVSTFSIDVDTGSYTNTRRMLTQENRLPPQDAVRAEEFINYFDYAYKQPANRAQPFSVTTELGLAPWNAKHELLLIGLKGFEMQKSEIPAANLVFLLDVSGSMDEPNKLPLLKASITQMVERMTARDRVSIVVYAGAAGLVLEPTPGNQHETILAALNQLSAGGSTNGGEGIELAYQLATANKIAGGANRIILATDGEFNVGQFDQNKLKEFVASKRDSGVSLSTLGFGADNYNDAMAEQLADVGNGKYAYIDSIEEASRVLGREVAGSLYTIAGDVKIQIEFNPSLVSEYRLIGYDNRMLAREDFNNDKIDAGDIGAGHTVTALYEITRAGSGGEAIDPLRYAPKSAVSGGKELAFLKLRYKLPNHSESTLISQAIVATAQSSYRLQYAAMVAAFAEHLHGGKYLGKFGLNQIEQTLSKVEAPAKAELLHLIAIAKQIEVASEQRPVAQVQISVPAGK